MNLKCLRYIVPAAFGILCLTRLANAQDIEPYMPLPDSPTLPNIYESPMPGCPSLQQLGFGGIACSLQALQCENEEQSCNSDCEADASQYGWPANQLQLCKDNCTVGFSTCVGVPTTSPVPMPPVPNCPMPSSACTGGYWKQNSCTWSGSSWVGDWSCVAMPAACIPTPTPVPVSTPVATPVPVNSPVSTPVATPPMMPTYTPPPMP